MTDRQLTLEDVARYPRPGMNAPNQVEFTPDNQKIAYLLATDGSLAQELWTYDLISGERQQLTQMATDAVSHTGVSAVASVGWESQAISLLRQLRMER